jgi:hypothetical protein
MKVLYLDYGHGLALDAAADHCGVQVTLQLLPLCSR